MNSVFIHIPKTGGTTIQECLGLEKFRYLHRVSNFKQEGNVTFGHINYKRLLREGLISKSFDENSFKFAFTRNPYDRAVSIFHWHKKKNEISKDLSFLDFSRNLKRTGYQKTYVKGVKLDFLGRYENFEQDLKYVANILGIDLKEVPRLNATKHRPYYTYYCEESKYNVEEYYRRDFEHFGYEQDNNLLYR